MEILPGLRTKVTLVPLHDCEFVCQAVSVLSAKVGPISITIKLNASKSISLLQLSNSEHVFLFQRRGNEELPVSLRLLLTHQDYKKVGRNVRDGLVGHIWRDFGVKIYPLFELMDVTTGVKSPVELINTFKKRTNCTIAINSHLADSDWDSELSQHQTEFASVEAFATLWLFSHTTSTKEQVVVDTKTLFYECGDCFARLESAAALRAHDLAKHCFKCDLCEVVLRSEALLHDHERNKHTHKCQWCDHVARTVSDIEAHTHSMHSLRCPLCHVLVRTEERLQQHNTANHFQCPDCKDWLIDSQSMEDHEREKHSFACQFLCPNSKFRSQQILDDHMSSQHIQCHLCGGWSENEFRYSLHIDLDHPSCLSCGEQFKNPLELKQHTYARVNHRCYLPPGHSPTHYENSIASNQSRSTSPSKHSHTPTRTWASTTTTFTSSSSYGKSYKSPYTSPYKKTSSPTKPFTSSEFFEDTNDTTVRADITNASFMNTSSRPDVPQLPPGIEPWIAPPVRVMPNATFAATPDKVGQFF